MRSGTAEHDLIVKLAGQPCIRDRTGILEPPPTVSECAGCEVHVDDQDVIVHAGRIVHFAQLDRGRQANSRRRLPTASLGYGDVKLMIELTTKEHDTRGTRPLGDASGVAGGLVSQGERDQAPSRWGAEKATVG